MNSTTGNKDRVSGCGGRGGARPNINELHVCEDNGDAIASASEHGSRLMYFLLARPCA